MRDHVENSQAKRDIKRRMITEEGDNELWKRSKTNEEQAWIRWRRICPEETLLEEKRIGDLSSSTNKP